MTTNLHNENYNPAPAVSEAQANLLAIASNAAVPDEKLGLRYLANVRVDRDWMQVGSQQVSLSPGMSVTVDIKTGQRRLIEYFLSPLLRLKQESARER